MPALGELLAQELAAPTVDRQGDSQPKKGATRINSIPQSVRKRKRLGPSQVISAQEYDGPPLKTNVELIRALAPGAGGDPANVGDVEHG